MRHLLGIRESMFAMAKKCYPSVQVFLYFTVFTCSNIPPVLEFTIILFAFAVIWGHLNAVVQRLHA